jgi:hypothetical protein
MALDLGRLIKIFKLYRTSSILLHIDRFKARLNHEERVELFNVAFWWIANFLLLIFSAS